MPKKRINLLNSTGFLVFLLVPFFKPASLALLSPAADTCFDAWRVLSFTLIAALYLWMFRPSKMIAAITAYEGALLLSTILNSGNYWGLAVSCGTVIGFCMLTEICVKQNASKYFSTVFGIYFVLITINFVLLLMFPEGLAVDDYYSANIYNFLGIDNSLAVNVSLPLMSVACLYSAFKMRRFTVASVLMIAMISASVLITWSATGVVAWFALFTYMLVVYKGGLTKALNAYVLFLLFVVMQATIVFLRLQEHFSYIIETILGKTITFSGRVFIWDMSYVLIAQSPIIGHGVYEGHGLINIAGREWYAHNAVLEILVQSGAVGLTLFTIPFVMAARKLFRHRNHFMAGIVAMTLFSFLITFLMEAQISAIWIFGFLVIADNIAYIIGQLEGCAQQIQPDLIRGGG